MPVLRRESLNAAYAQPTQHIVDDFWHSKSPNDGPLDCRRSRRGSRCSYPGKTLPCFAAPTVNTALTLALSDVLIETQGLTVRRRVVRIHADIDILNLSDPSVLAACKIPVSVLTGEDVTPMRLLADVARRRRDIDGILAPFPEHLRALDEPGAVLVIFPDCLTAPFVEVLANYLAQAYFSGDAVLEAA